jgi:ribosome recycling factor
MNENEIKQKMEQVVDLYAEDIATIRTGRATPALIEEIEISVYGGQQKMKLKQLGSVTVPDARSLVFQPWDGSIINEIKNGIVNSGTGLTPAVDGTIIRISLPPLTTEQREEYIRLLSKKTEAVRVMIRNVRSDERKELQDQLKEKLISEDEFKRFEDQLQKFTDEYIEKVEAKEAVKEKEIRGE